MSAASRLVRHLQSFTNPNDRVAALVATGRHGTRDNPDDVLAWAIDQAQRHNRESQSPEERLPYKD